jgi:hypothetical protein
MDKAQQTEQKERELELLSEKTHENDFPPEIRGEPDHLLSKLKALGREKLWGERLPKFPGREKIENNPLAG